MKNWLLFLISFSFVFASTQGASQSSTDELNPFPAKTALDLDLDLGISLRKEDSQIFSRARIGKFWMQNTDVFAAGLSLGKFSNFGFGGGAEGELINLTSGLWVQGKLLSTQNEILVTGLAVGWSLIGVEGLISPLNSNKAAIYAKVRLPIGLLNQ